MAAMILAHRSGPESRSAGAPSGGATRRAVLHRATAAAAGGVLAACQFGSGARDQAGSPSALAGKIQVAYRSDVRTRQVYGAITEELQKAYPALQVEVIDVGGNYDTPLFNLFVADTPPDVFWARITNYGGYLAKGLLLNIDPYAKRDGRAAQLDDIFPGILEQARHKGGLYGLPSDGGGPALIWNVGMVEERAGRGQDPGTLNDAGRWTQPAFLDLARRVTRKNDPANATWGAHDPLYHSSVWLSWLWAFGGDLYNKDSTAITIDQPAAIEFLQWQQDAIIRQGVVPNAAELAQVRERGPIDRRGMFLNGQVAMISDWVTFLGMPALKQAEEKGLRWEATLLPSGRGGQFSCAFFHEMCAAARTRVPEAAWKALSHYAGPAATLTKSKEGTTFPYRRSTMTNQEYLRNWPPVYARMHAKLGERARPYPVLTNDADMQNMLNEEMGQLRDGKKSPRDVAQAIKQRGEPILKGA